MNNKNNIKTKIMTPTLFNNKKDKKGKFTFIDLFAGIGGTRMGFEKVGGECVFTSEWGLRELLIAREKHYERSLLFFTRFQC